MTSMEKRKVLRDGFIDLNDSEVVDKILQRFIRKMKTAEERGDKKKESRYRKVCVRLLSRLETIYGGSKK